MPLILPPSLRQKTEILGKFISVQIVVQAIGFASSLLLIRVLDKQQYAYFTIANTMQGAMNVLADTGISIGLSKIGGKVWQDRHRFGQLIATAMQLRYRLALISVTVITPILLWMLVSNGASSVYAVLISLAILVELKLYLENSVLGFVPRLHSQIERIQNLDLLPAILRLFLLCVAYLTIFNTAIAVWISVIASGLQGFYLRHWVPDCIDTRATSSEEYRTDILKLIKNLAPNSVFYCLQGQLSIWLISIFGNTQNIAEIGALSRLGAVFAVISSVFTNIAIPRFSRCQSAQLVRQQYWQMLGILCLFGFSLIVATAIFPAQILWILGNKYSHLLNEILLMVINVVITSIADAMWAINASRAWVGAIWLEIPTKITMQIFLLLILDISTVRGVILFSIFSIFPSLLLNIYMTYAGFKITRYDEN